MSEEIKDITNKLEPDFEIEPGWWKLKWRPIKHRDTIDSGNWNIYLSKHRSLRYWGFSLYTIHERQGPYGFTYKCQEFVFTFFIWTIKAWIKWDFVVHKDGRNDWHQALPLDLSKVKQ